VTALHSDALGVFESTLVWRGCISETGSGGACADGKALDGAAGMAAHGTNVYVTSKFSDAVAAFRRLPDLRPIPPID
jgi:hypothetical protein